MAEVYTKSTRYKVLDVRECIHDDQKPIVLICNEFGKFARRRIEVWPWDKKAYEDALIIVSGDVINVVESWNKNGHGGHTIDEIEC